MFDIIRLALKVFLKRYTLDDRESCRKFVRDLLLLVGPAASATKTDLDDRLLEQIERIVENDVLFGFLYDLVRDQFQSDGITFTAPEDARIESLCERANRDEPEAISPAVVIGIVLQLINLINTLKK